MSLNYSEFKIVFAKELLDASRDWRQLLLLLAIPAFLLPFALLTANAMGESSAAAITSKKVHLGVAGDFEPIRPFIGKCGFNFLIMPLDKGDLKAAVRSKKVDVAVAFPDDFSQALKDGKSHLVVTAFFDGSGFDGFSAKTKVETLLNLARSHYIQERLRSFAIDDRLGTLVPAEYGDLEWGESESILGSAIVLMTVVVVFAVAIYPALDFITGERERGTLSLLLMAPANRRSILAAKLLVVAACGLAAAAVEIISLSLLVHFAYQALPIAALRRPLTACLMFALSIPLVLLLSIIAMLISSYASTFQQGQGYFSPVFLTIIAIVTVPLLAMPNSITDSLSYQ